MSESKGVEFVQALADKDEEALARILDPAVDFRAMTPGKFWEANTVPEIVKIVFGSWMTETEHVEAVEAVETETLVDRYRVGYRLRMRTDEGRFLVAQQAFFDTAGDRITWLRIMCAGFLPA